MSNFVSKPYKRYIESFEFSLHVLNHEHHIANHIYFIVKLIG